MSVSFLSIRRRLRSSRDCCHHSQIDTDCDGFEAFGWLCGVVLPADRLVANRRGVAGQLIVVDVAARTRRAVKLCL